MCPTSSTRPCQSSRAQPCSPAPLPGLRPGHSVKSLHLLPPSCSWAPLSVSLSHQAAPAPGLWLLSCRAHGLPHTTVPSFLQGSSPRHHSYISACSLQLPVREGARARPSAQWALKAWCSASCGSHPTTHGSALTARSLDISPWILTPGTEHSPSRHLASCLGSSFILSYRCWLKL